MTVALLILLVAITVATALVVAYSFHKIRRIHLIVHDMERRLDEEIRRQSVTHFQQLQLLRRLEQELSVDEPLPPMRGMAASPDILLMLARHCRRTAPDVIVECGSGVSTVVLARCLQLNGGGLVYSLDADARFAEETRRELDRRGLGSFAVVLDAPLTRHTVNGETVQWYDTSALPKTEIDMMFIDGPPTWTGPLARLPAGPILFPRLKPGGTVFADDTARADETRAVDRWLTLFPDLRKTEHFAESGCITLTRPAA
jgi:predicted O-methyltransferase YrrM